MAMIELNVEASRFPRARHAELSARRERIALTERAQFRKTN
jgi:hypothetical protein